MMNQPSQNLPNKKRQQNKFNNSASSANSGGAGADLLGRVPPHSVEAEQGVLGGVLRRGDALHNVVDILTEYDFYLPAHQFIYAAFLDLFNKLAVHFLNFTSHWHLQLWRHRPRAAPYVRGYPLNASLNLKRQ